MQFHVEAPALPVLDAVSASLCAACLVKLQPGASSCFGFGSGSGL